MSSDVFDAWPPANTPPLEWPAFPDQTARLDWYRACIDAYAALWENHASCPVVSPISEEKVEALEARLDCKLPVPFESIRVRFLSLKDYAASRIAPRRSVHSPKPSRGWTRLSKTRLRSIWLAS